MSSCKEPPAAIAPDDELTPDEHLTASDMVRILGIPKATFQQWCRRGVMPALIVHHKGRTYRRFTMQECWRAAVIGMLYRLGYEPQLSANLADVIISAKNEALLRRPGLPGDPVNMYVAI